MSASGASGVSAVIVVIACFGTAACPAENNRIPWDIEKLSDPPAFREDPEHAAGNVKAIFFDGLPWKGKPTRVFAYYGVPKTDPAKKAPAMVLVHGGGGSAFVPWVRLWLKRGYAAIAMDTCGSVSGGGYKNHPRHEDGGPPGWGGFDQVDEPVADQWTYHAVADVILAHSLIRSLPGVDPERVGLTGISWGGYLTCIVAGVDDRFRFAAPVYGCGFLGENSTWLGRFKKMGPAKAKKWLGRWDPAVYLPRAVVPILWVTGTNDFAYPLDSLQKSYRLPKGPRTLSIRIRMPHGHGGPGENPEEIRAMADHVLKGGPPPARITKTGREGNRAWATYTCPGKIESARLCWTTDTGTWKKRKWQTRAAAVDPKARRVTADLPAGTRVWYFNLVDDRGLLVSTEHAVVEAPAGERE